MKKILFILMMLFTVTTVNAQSIATFLAHSYAYANINQYTGRYNWSPWYQCQVRIIINLNTDVVDIYSRSPQHYMIIGLGQEGYDNDGGYQVVYPVVDQDGDIGSLRLRIEASGNSQLYIDFSNVAWVYNVIRT